MRIFIGFFCTALLLTGCSSNETAAINGKISSINDEEDTFVLYIGDTLTEEKQKTTDINEDDKVIEAVLVKTTDNTVIKGEADTFDELKADQKVTVGVEGGYQKEPVTFETFTQNHEQLPVYKTEKVTAVPYTKQEIISEMTVNKGEYGLYIYNAEPNEEGVYEPYPISHENFQFQKLVMIQDVSEVKNTEELLGLYEDSPTYIVTDENGVVYKTNKEKELNAFVEKRKKKQTN